MLDAARRALLLLAVGSLLAGCVGSYQDAIGYRARQASMQRDAAAFPSLMAEAAETEPKSRLDNPKKTVLTHYLTLADEPNYLETVRAWEANGWVEDDMICPVYRAHAAAHLEDASGAESAARCVDHARAAVGQADEGRAEIDRCLLEAKFLVASATTALTPYLGLAVSDAEPLALRQGLWRGLTHREQFGPRDRWGVTSTLTIDRRRLLTERDARRWAARLRWTLDALETRGVPAPELAIASARGAMEVEHVLMQRGESFVRAYAEAERPDHRTWAWGWVRAMKARPRIERLGGLGLWDRSREPAADAFWYVCHGAPEVRSDGPLGPRRLVRAETVRASARVPPAVAAARCTDAATRLGPYPLEQVARAAAMARLGAGPRVLLRVDRRHVLESE